MRNSRALLPPGQIKTLFPQGYPRYFLFMPSSPGLLHCFPTGLPTGQGSVLGESVGMLDSWQVLKLTNSGLSG